MPDLAIRLRADTAEFQSDMGKGAHIAEREMERMVARATAAGELIGRALSNAASGFGRMITETLRAGDELSKLSQKSGFAVERLSELRFAAQLSDVSFGQVTTALGAFNKALAESQNEGSKTGQLFSALGVDIKAGPQQAFEQFAKAVQSLDPETKVAAMRIAFRRTGDSLIPLINSMDEASEKARRLGIVMSTQLARDSERFNDAVTTLSASSRALAITALTPASAALATIAENLVRAKEQGTQFRDIGAEIGKVFLAAHGQILSYVPIWGQQIEAATQRAFNALERLREGSRVEGVRPIGGQFSGPPDPPDKQARVACVVSGGRWEGGVCVRQRERAGRTPRDPTLSAEQVARLQNAADEDEAKTIAEAWKFVPEMTDRLKEWDSLVASWGEDSFMGMSLEDARAWVANQFEALDVLNQIEDASKRVAAGFTEDGKAITESTKKVTDEMVEFWRRAAESMQQSMSSLFFDLMQGDLRNFGQSFKRTIDRMVADVLAAKAATTLFGADFGKSDSVGGWVGQGLGWIKDFVGSFDSGTESVPRTGLALVHAGEAIIPAAQNVRGARGVTINMPVHFHGQQNRDSVSQGLVRGGRAVQRELERNT